VRRFPGCCASVSRIQCHSNFRCMLHQCLRLVAADLIEIIDLLIIEIMLVQRGLLSVISFWGAIGRRLGREWAPYRINGDP
jgi:hypothetical protein